MNRNPRYIFDQGITTALEGFKSSLQGSGMDKGTIRQKSNYVGYFLRWLQGERLTARDAMYNDLLGFIDHCRLEGDSTSHINSRLRSIRNFYEYLKTRDPEVANPAANLFLKGARHRVVSGVIDFNVLENLYRSYPARTLREKRNRVILGLLIYQGLSTDDLRRLEVEHVKVKEGRIHVSGDHRRGGRNLELKPFQVMELHEYLTKLRPEIIRGINMPGPARKPDRINRSRLESQLFVSINGSENIKNSLLHLFRGLKKMNPGIINANKIRQSVITYWLKTMNLRQVQYMAGHRYVSSTERYQRSNLEILQSKLEKYHPLGRRG
jgi:integrase/recombinase XerD